MRSIDTVPAIHWQLTEAFWTGEAFGLRVKACLAEVPALWLDQNLGGRLKAAFGGEITAEVASSRWLRDDQGDHHKELGYIEINNLEVPFPQIEKLRDVIMAATKNAYDQARDATRVIEGYRDDLKQLGTVVPGENASTGPAADSHSLP